MDALNDPANDLPNPPAPETAVEAERARAFGPEKFDMLRRNLAEIAHEAHRKVYYGEDADLTLPFCDLPELEQRAWIACGVAAAQAAVCGMASVMYDAINTNLDLMRAAAELQG